MQTPNKHSRAQTNASPDFSDRRNNPDRPKKFTKQLRGEDLIKFAGKDNFIHKNTLRATNNTVEYEQTKADDDMRSVRTEYDYNNKKNFVELLG